MGKYRIGFDVGGTFTDFVVQDEQTGEFTITKRLTTPHDPSLAVMSGIEHIFADLDISFHNVSQAIHATTIATNLVLERKGDKTVLITTRGFRDVLLIGRQKRYELYDLSIDKPVPLIPRRLIWEVSERVLADGSVFRSLDEDEVRLIARQLREEQIRSVAVCLLHSYANPVHEELIRDILWRELPELNISLSSEISAKYREFERASTTVMNAYVMPAVKASLKNMTKAFKSKGLETDLYIMHSHVG